MRKNVFGRQFSRDTNQRKSLFKSLITSLILEESIKTTLEKAKAIKGDVDKIINQTKRGDEKLAIQLLQRRLGIEAMKKAIKDLAPRFRDRTSGYTRIIKLGRRFSDNAEMAVMEWVVKKEIKDPAKGEARYRRQKSSIRQAQDKNGVKELPAGKIEEKLKTENKEIKIAKKETKRKVAKR